MVLEGGSITVDGQGTLITTESCLLRPSRNPGLTKAEIEQGLKEYLGVEKVIWLVSGLGLEEDPDTDGHVDGVAAFIGPARVLLHMVRDPSHPGYADLPENRRRLETTDALGRPLEVVELDLRGSPVSVEGRNIVETYINLYQANGAVVVPTAGNAAIWPPSASSARSSRSARWSACPRRSWPTAAAGSTASRSRCRPASKLSVKLAGRAAIVTGAASGIGLATARLLQKRVLLCGGRRPASDP